MSSEYNTQWINTELYTHNKPIRAGFTITSTKWIMKQALMLIIMWPQENQSLQSYSSQDDHKTARPDRGTLKFCASRQRTIKHLEQAFVNQPRKAWLICRRVATSQPLINAAGQRHGTSSNFCCLPVSPHYYPALYQGPHNYLMAGNKLIVSNIIIETNMVCIPSFVGTRCRSPPRKCSIICAYSGLFWQKKIPPHGSEGTWIWY